MMKAASGKRTEKFETEIQRVSNKEISAQTDTLAVEEPLEIRLGFGRQHRAVSITMRTPGNDLDTFDARIAGAECLDSAPAVTPKPFIAKLDALPRAGAVAKNMLPMTTLA